MPLTVPGLIVTWNAAATVGVSVTFVPPPGYVNVARLPLGLNVAVPVPAGATVVLDEVGVHDHAPGPVLVNSSFSSCAVPRLSYAVTAMVCLSPTAARASRLPERPISEVARAG